MASSSATRSDAATIGEWLSEVARRLRTVEPAAHLGDVLDATFTRPLTDPAYRRNALSPGALPIEVSFSEETPDELRLDLQPADVDCPPGHRRELALNAICEFAPAAYRERCTVWEPYCSTERFGAFMAAAFAPDGMTAVKVYLELDQGVEPSRLPGRLGEAAAMIAEHAPGVVPHLVSVATAGSTISERVYLACRGGLRVLAMDALLTGMGLRHRLPALALAVAELTGGRLILPEDSALIAVGERHDGIELKVELLPDALVRPDRATVASIERLLLDRPRSYAAFRRWRHGIAPPADGALSVAGVGVVSVRLAGDDAPRLNVYQRLASQDVLGR